MRKREFLKLAPTHAGLNTGMGCVVYYASGALFSGKLVLNEYGMTVHYKSEERVLNYDNVQSVDLIHGGKTANVYYNDMA